MNKTSFSKLFREVDCLRKKITESGSPFDNNELWSVQQSLQVNCGQLLISHQELALEKAVERDLWNFGFRTTITQLQSEAREKKKSGNEVKDILNWFLNAASGFYLQLLNQICSTNSLDLVFRRKDSVYGLMGGRLSTVNALKAKDSATKNALYLCQYCLIHLGDLARYRHQAKQAETYYRHAVSVAATSGHPYNQLALLEAGRGNRLPSVFLYIRALCLPAPFPGAPSNLIQTLNKVLLDRKKDDISNYDEIHVGTLTRMTKEEYINLFLHFHSVLFLKGDLELARDDLPRLSSALSMLVAATTLTRSNLVQMFAVNIFALNYFSGCFSLRIAEDNINKKEEEKLVEPKECEGAVDVIEELMVGMLAALLLPVHTMKESELMLTYIALPTIRFMFEWILLEEKLNSTALKKKQQIWPGLSSLVNFLQEPLNHFNSEQYEDVPLPEDWDLQEFQPLQKILCRYKYKESNPRLMPDRYALLRAKRMTDLASKFAKEDNAGGPVLKVSVDAAGLSKFDPLINQSLPVQEVLDLERMTLQPKQDVSPSLKTTKSSSNANRKKEKVGILKLQGTLEKSKQPLKEQQPPRKSTTQILVKDQSKDASITAEKKNLLNTSDESSRPGTTVIAKPKSLRTNVALQAIMKRNSNNQEAKQVTFRTPSPSISPNAPVTFDENKHNLALNLNSLANSPINNVRLPPPLSSIPNQSLPFHQRLPPPPSASMNSLDIHNSINKSFANYGQQTPPGSQNFSNVPFTKEGSSTFVNARNMSNSNPVFGSGEDSSKFYSSGRSPVLVGLSQEQPLYNRTSKPAPFSSQSSLTANLYGNSSQPPASWNASSVPDNNLRPMSAASTRIGMFTATDPTLSNMSHSFGSSHSQNLLPALNLFGNGTQSHLFSETSLPANSNVNLASNFPPQKSSSNFYPSESQNNFPWWNKETASGVLGNQPYKFSSLGAQQTYQGNRVSPPLVDTSIPPPQINTSQFLNQGLTRGLGTQGNMTAFSSNSSITKENQQVPHRTGSTYSLFGPLGGARADIIQQTFPHSDNLMMHSNTADSGRLQGQPQQFPSHQSLWSGPSPLQRLLEQKKFSKK